MGSAWLLGPKLGSLGPLRVDQEVSLMNSEEERSKTPSTAAAPDKARARASGPIFVSMARLVCVLLPGIVAGAGASAASTAAHDDGIVRTAGAGFTGALRALDLLVAAPAMLLPVGTRGLRAGLASALVTAICGALSFDLAHGLVRVVIPSTLDRLGLRSKRAVSPGLLAAVAAASVLTALLSPSWQSEACAPGGSVTGALLVLVALWLGTGAALPSGPALAFVLGLAGSYEPLVFVAALAALAPRMVRWRRVDGEDRASAARVACAFALGLVPLGVGIALSRRAPEIAFDVPLLTWVERGLRTASWQTFLASNVGTFFLVVCASGAVLSLVAARAHALGLVLVVAVGALALALGTSAGPTRFAAPVLTAILAAHVLGATTLGGLVVAIARARVPFSEASAALLVVLELVLPVKSLDETTARRAGRAQEASAIWSDIAWGQAPPAAVVLVADRGTMQRVASARALGAMRGDLVVVPAFDVQGRAGRRALASEPKLAPLFRDIALGIPPEELSLATLSAQRPVLATFDPKWERSLARHLVPVGLSSRFEAEPRGSSDRKQALDAFLPLRDRLARLVVASKDAELAAATAALLRARAVGMAATGEREMLSRALDDLRAFAPEDPIGATLVRRIVTTKGPIDVRDLALDRSL